MDAYKETRVYPAVPNECYRRALETLPALGFTVTRKRDIAWLILAEKRGDPARDGAGLYAIISCRPGEQTEVSAVCERRGGMEEQAEQHAVRAFFDAMDRALLPVELAGG